jgi:hypothetical protein
VVIGAVPPTALGLVGHVAASLAAAPVTAPRPVAETTMAPAPAATVLEPLVTAEPVIVADTAPDTTRTTPRTPRRTDTATKVAKLAAKHPGMKPADIAVKVGVSDRTVRRHLSALAAAAA